jgi:DNA polymerase-3 subunit delta'
MPIHPLFGHQSTRRELARALRSGRLPQVLLLVGEQGVGKQRIALWLAQLGLCRNPSDEPCGSCPSCLKTANLAHPDLHWFVPVPRPKAGDSDKQIEEVRETLAELMEARRASPVYGPPDGMASHGVASARLLQKTASLTTVEGGRRYLIVGDAERLVPQESSPEAANALLKLLEEPPASTTIVLTTTDPSRVLPTIRSRAVPVRVRRVSDAELEEALGVLLPDEPPAARRKRIASASGVLGSALAGDSGNGPVHEAAREILDAARQGGAARFERSLRQAPWSARGEFTAVLDRLSEMLGQAARATVVGSREVDIEVDDPGRVLVAMASVDRAREAARGNVNPQLLLAVLTRELGEALWA